MLNFSFTGICVCVCAPLLSPEREWKQKVDTQGSAIFGPGCRLPATLGPWLLAQGCVFLPSLSPWGEGLKPLMLPPFHLGHVPRKLTYL